MLCELKAPSGENYWITLSLSKDLGKVSTTGTYIFSLLLQKSAIKTELQLKELETLLVLDRTVRLYLSLRCFFCWRYLKPFGTHCLATSPSSHWYRLPSPAPDGFHTHVTQWSFNKKDPTFQACRFCWGRWRKSHSATRLWLWMSRKRNWIENVK